MSAHSPFRAALRRDPTQAFWRDPALPFVESRRACHSRACYKPHHHPTFSIGAVDEGNPSPDTAWSYQMLHLDAAWFLDVRREYAQARPLDAEPIRVVTDPSVYARFCQLNALLFSEVRPCDKEAALIEFIGDCDTRQGLRIEAPGVPSNPPGKSGRLWIAFTSRLPPALLWTNWRSWLA